MLLDIEIIKNEAKWKLHKKINKVLSKKILQNIIQRFPAFDSCKTIEVAILLTNDSQIQELNKNFRQKDKPTNVLSFPDADLMPQIFHKKNFFKAYLCLGDIAFAYETIQKEALEIQISFENHFTHLLVHAMLHLLGFDHEQDEEAMIMESLEISILKDFNIASPY